jgi:hypothetical protein
MHITGQNKKRSAGPEVTHARLPFLFHSSIIVAECTCVRLHVERARVRSLGSIGTCNAGHHPPKTFAFDITPGRLTQLSLTVEQTPHGFTRHEISVLQHGSWRSVRTLEGTTSNGQHFSLSFDLPGITSIRVTTTASPSWVAWRGIEAHGSLD